MKKIKLLFAVITLTLVSCKKSYQCNCDYIYGNKKGSSITYTIVSNKKSSKEKCTRMQDYEIDYKTSEQHQLNVCSLK